MILVDDHAVVRAGYRMLLQNEPEIDIVAEADSGELAYQHYSAFKPDVLIMDLSLPGMGGLEAIRRIVSRDHDARILVFSMHEDVAFVGKVDGKYKVKLPDLGQWRRYLRAGRKGLWDVMPAYRKVIMISGWILIMFSGYLLSRKSKGATE